MTFRFPRIAVLISAVFIYGTCGGVESLYAGEPGEESRSHAEQSNANEESENTDSLSSEPMLKKVTKVYEKCSTYRDSGMQTYTWTRENGSIGNFRRAFRTAFKRGHQFAMGPEFRFTYRISINGRPYHSATILWHDGPTTMIGEENQKGRFVFEKQDSLGLAAASLTGVSAGICLNIPNLLMPDRIRGIRIVDLVDPKAPTIEQVEDKTCYRIEGTLGNDRTVLWIDCKTFLISKIDEYGDVVGVPSLTSTEYSPVLNDEVPDALLDKLVEGEWDDLKDPTSEENGNLDNEK